VKELENKLKGREHVESITLQNKVRAIKAVPNSVSVPMIFIYAWISWIR